MAQDWVPYQQASGFIVPRFLDWFAPETQNVFHNVVHRIDNADYVRFMVFGDGDRKGIFPDSQLAYIYQARRLRDAKVLYDTYPPGSISEGQKEIAFSATVLRFAQQAATKKEFEEAHEIIDLYIDNADVQAAYHLAIDSTVYLAARNAHELDKAVEFTHKATTDLGRLAMRAALDRRVLQHALKHKSTEYAEGARIINEFASTSTAREAMLGYVAVRGKTNARTGHRRRYKPRVDPKIWQKHLEDQLRKQRKREEERFKQWEKDREQQNKEFRERLNRMRGARSDSKDPYDRAMAAVRDPRLFRSLKAFPREDVSLVIFGVDNLRKIQPDITPRQIYMLAHAKAQMIEATEHETNAAKILGLFMGGEFGKDATLPF